MPKSYGVALPRSSPKSTDVPESKPNNFFKKSVIRKTT